MPGYFVLSLDVELAWGTFDKNGLVIYKNHFEKYRENFDKLIQLINKYKMSATWAMVGHLFLDQCDGRHDNILRPKYSWFNRQDWHVMDPGTSIEKDPYWYGKDIVDKILSIDIPQEIGTHTFSHVVIGDNECTDEIAHSQIKESINLAKERGIDIRTLIFPRGNVGHLKAIAEAGIQIYRGKEQSWYRSIELLYLRKICHIVDQFLGISPPTYPIESLEKVEGMLNIPSSQMLLAYDGFRKYIPSSSRLKKARSGMEKAINGNEIYHVWFHPFNLGSSDRMLEVLEEIFSFADKKRAEGQLHIVTMKEVLDIYNSLEVSGKPCKEN